jgi:hypothetical protein
MPFIWMPTVFCAKLVLWEVFRLLKAEAFMSLGQVRTSNFRDQRWGCRDEQGGYARPDSWDSLKRAECDAPAPWQNGTVNGVQVSVCSSDCRVHSRGASPRILSNFPGGQPQTPSPSYEPPRPPNLNYHRIRSLSASWICSHSLLVVLYPPDSVSSTVCA